jgi:DNA-binding PadR family transcriptional regulator
VSRANQLSRPGLPLTPPVFYVLLSLNARDRHGYDILRHVRDSSQGRVRLGPGTLYTTIRRLLEAGLIAEADQRGDPELDDARRRYYQLTGLGREHLTAEVRRMEQALQLARAELAEGPSR